MHLELAILFTGFFFLNYLDFTNLSKILFLGLTMSCIKSTIIMKCFRSHPKLDFPYIKFFTNTIVYFFMIEVYIISPRILLMEFFCIIAFYLMILSIILQIINHCPEFNMERKLEIFKQFLKFSIFVILILLSFKYSIFGFIRDRQFVLGLSYRISQSTNLSINSHYVYRNLDKLKNLIINEDERRYIQIVDETTNGENCGIHNSFEVFNTFSGPKLDFSLSPLNATDIGALLINLF